MLFLIGFAGCMAVAGGVAWALSLMVPADGRRQRPRW